MIEKERFDIYVPQEVKNMLESDALQFEFLKSDNLSLNMNRFLTTIIREYHQSFVSEQIRAADRITAEIRDLVPDEAARLAIVERIRDQVLFPDALTEKSRKKERLSLKPTKAIQHIIRSIPDTKLPDASVSKYFCKLFTSYCAKPISARERIVFAEHLSLLEEACENGWNLEFTTKTSPYVHQIVPYCIATGKEEMFNYLLCAEMFRDGTVKTNTYRINRISWIAKSPAGRTIGEDVMTNIRRMLKNTPLYAINDDPLIRIRMSEEGKNLYRRIYYGRPDYCGITHDPQGDIYCFDCSINQAFFYFRRFDQDAVSILEPPELIDKMSGFFMKAVRSFHLSDPS